MQNMARGEKWLKPQQNLTLLVGHGENADECRGSLITTPLSLCGSCRNGSYGLCKFRNLRVSRKSAAFLWTPFVHGTHSIPPIFFDSSIHENQVSRAFQRFLNTWNTCSTGLSRGSIFTHPAACCR